MSLTGEILTLANARALVDEHAALNFYVITGEPLDRIRKGNTERNLRAFPFASSASASRSRVHRERQVGVAKQLFSRQWALRDDKERRQDWSAARHRQFDAPVCVDHHDRVLAAMTTRRSIAPSRPRWSTPPGRGSSGP